MFKFRLYTLLAFLFISLNVAPAFSADEAFAHISEPTDGSVIKAMARNKLKYEVSGADGVHARLYINGLESVLLRRRIGSHRIAKLPAGTHELCVQALNKSHKEVGVRNCVKVTAQ